MGTYKGLGGNRRIGLAVVVRFKGKLYPFGVLERRQLVNDSFNGDDLLIYYSTRSGTATAWRRTLGKEAGTKETANQAAKETLTFERSERKDAQGNTLLRDRRTGSLWSWLTGEAVAGALKGSKLDRAMYTPILNDRFKAFYPDA